MTWFELISADTGIKLLLTLTRPEVCWRYMVKVLRTLAWTEDICWSNASIRTLLTLSWPKLCWPCLLKVLPTLTWPELNLTWCMYLCLWPDLHWTVLTCWRYLLTLTWIWLNCTSCKYYMTLTWPELNWTYLTQVSPTLTWSATSAAWTGWAAFTSSSPSTWSSLPPPPSPSSPSSPPPSGRRSTCASKQPSCPATKSRQQQMAPMEWWRRTRRIELGRVCIVCVGMCVSESVCVCLSVCVCRSYGWDGTVHENMLIFGCVLNMHHPEVTLCTWRDVKIQKLTNLNMRKWNHMWLCGGV